MIFCRKLLVSWVVIVLGGGCVGSQPVPVVQDLGQPVAPPAVPTMHDATQAAGLGEQGATYVNWLDVQNDGYPDLLVDGCRLYLNQGPPFYRLALAPRDMWPKTPRGPALCVDVDNDGWTDIVSTRGKLFRNLAGQQFRNVAEAWGFEPHAKANVLAAGDLDGDGWVDLYVGMAEDWNDGHPAYYKAELWRNRAGRGFEEVGGDARIDRKSYARGVLVFDVDGDGDQDVFVGNYRLQANYLWINDGSGRFREAAAAWGVAGRNNPKRYLDTTTKRRYGPQYGHTIGACLLDVDNDGATDIFAANLVHKYVGPSGKSYDIRGYVCDDSAIWRRRRRRFVDWRAQLGVPPLPHGGRGVCKGDELWAGCVAGDVNNDGWTDVFVPQIYNLPYARCRLFLNARGRRLIESSEAAGLSYIDSYAGAWADINCNGRLDLATGGREAAGKPSRLRLLWNKGGDAMMNNLWIKVSLRPGEGRRTVLGSVVTVSQGERQWTRELTCGTSTYGQQNDPAMHFGLGASDQDVLLNVLWPNGTRTEQTVRPATSLCLSMPAPKANGDAE